jgi:hypothetical protein
MKRDMDLVREVLIFIEEHSHGFAPDSISIEKYSDEQVGYHCYLMEQAGLVYAKDQTTMADFSPNWTAVAMTWKGHEFLDNAKHQGSWQQAKEVVEKLGDASFSVWTNVLTRIVMNNLGMDS